MDAAASGGVIATQDKHRIAQVIVQWEVVSRLVAEITDLNKIELWDRPEQSAELISLVDPQLVIGGDAADVVSTGTAKRESDSLNSFPPREFKNSDSGGDALPTISDSPALTVKFQSVRGQQVKAEDIDSSGGQRPGHTSEMLACGLLRKQMAECVDKAVSKCELLREFKLRHVCLQNSGCPAGTANSSLRFTHTIGIQIDCSDIKAAASHFHDLTSATTSDFEELPWH